MSRRRHRRSPASATAATTRHVHDEPRAADVDVGQHWFAETGPAVARQPVANAAVDRRVSRHRRNRQGGNDTADVVLLRPFGDPQPPAPRRRHHPDRPLRRRRRVLGAVPPASRDHVRGRALHLRTARPCWLRRARSAPPAVRHPGRRPDAARSACAASPHWRSAAAGTCSSCTGRPRRPPEWPICHPNSRYRDPTRSADRFRGGSFTIEPLDGWATTMSASWSTAAPT